jgi:Rrf2 family protein
LLKKGDIMQISSRFTMAIHILTCVVVLRDDMPMNSETIAASVGVNPVIIRNMFSRLKKAGLIQVHRGGSGGVTLAKDPEAISLYDIYRAVDSVENNRLFHFHEHPNPGCTVGRSIHHALDGRLDDIQEAMEARMKTMTLADVIDDTIADIDGEDCPLALDRRA